MRTHSILLATTIILCSGGTRTAFAEPPFQEDLVPPGDAWLCSADDACDRYPVRCRSGECASVEQAYALTADGTFSAFRTLDACEAGRETVTLGGMKPSACALVGTRAVPPPKVARGRGWYCSTHGQISDCSRSRTLCARARKATIKQARDTSKIGRCVHQQTAWATQPLDDDPAVVRATEAQCKTYRQVWGSYPCVEVR